jgi:GH18 family chitinase
MIGDLKFLTALRKHNPNLQILVSLRPSSNQFSLEDTSKLNITALTVRKKFASRVRDFITRHGLDGVDLDWSYFKDPQNSNSKRETLISVLRVSTSVLSLFFTLNNFLSLTHFMHSFYFIIKYFNIFQTVIAQ